MAIVPVYYGGSPTLTFGPSSTHYASFGDSGAIISTTTESQTQITWRTAGIFSSLRAKLSSNTYALLSSTIKFRVGGANGNQALSIPAGSTGEFVDAVDTDTITAGSQIDLQIVTQAGAGDFISITSVSLLFAASSKTVKKIVAANATSTFATAAATGYIRFGGALSPVALETTEANAQAKLFVNGTLTNFFVNVVTNARTTTTTLGSRIGGVNGNLSVSVLTTATGIYEDTTDSDTLSSAGTLVCFYQTNGAGPDTGAFGMHAVGAELTTTDSTSVVVNAGGKTNTATTTAYGPFGGILTNGDLNESDTPIQAQTPFTVSKLTIHVQNNSGGGVTTLNLRKNGGNGNSSVSIPTLTTGFLTDSSDSDSVVPTDELDYQIVSATATNFTPSSISAQIAIAAGFNLLMMMGAGT